MFLMFGQWFTLGDLVYGFADSLIGFIKDLVYMIVVGLNS